MGEEWIGGEQDEREAEGGRRKTHQMSSWD